MSIHELLKAQFELRIYEEGIWRIEKVLDMLSIEEIWHSHNATSNSIGHLVLHLCGNVTQWIGSGIGSQSDDRTRDWEFAATEKFNHDALKIRLRALKPITDAAMAKITSDDDLKRSLSIQGFEETVLGVLVHVIEHFSYHTGQIAIMAKILKGEDLGFYADMNLNITN